MPTAASPIDRLSELLNIGAGHAASALALLLGRTFWMRVPRALRVGADAAPLAGELALRHEIARGGAPPFEGGGSAGWRPGAVAPGCASRARSWTRRASCAASSSSSPTRPLVRSPDAGLIALRAVDRERLRALLESVKTGED